MTIKILFHEKLKKLIKDDILVDKILDTYSFFGKLSASLLIRKFRLNLNMANLIVALSKDYERDVASSYKS